MEDLIDRLECAEREISRLREILSQLTQSNSKTMCKWDWSSPKLSW